MAKSSINFQKASSHSMKHNFREDEPSYLLQEKDREPNEYWKHEKTAEQIFNDEVSKIEKGKKGKRPKFENSHWEAVLNLNANHTLAEVQKVAEHIEKKFNITCTAIAIHRDEGHYTDTGHAVKNYHAHLNFCTYKDLKQNWRHEKIKPQDLRELQTEIAGILKMERGVDKRESKTERLGPKEYKQKEKEKAELKKEIEAIKKELEAERLTSKEALQELEAIRKQMKGQGFTKEQFDYINELKRGQKEKKSEPMTREQIEQLKTDIENHSGFFSKKANVINALTEKLTEAENDKAVLNQIVSFTEQNEAKIIETIKQELENENKRILDTLKHEQETQLKTENEKFKSNLQYELIQEKNKLAVSRTSYERKTNDLAAAEAKAKEAETSYKNKRQELTQSSIIQELTQAHEADLKKEKEEKEKLKQKLQKLKADNERLEIIKTEAIKLKEIAEQELKEVKKQLKAINEAVERAIKGTWQIVYDRSAYGFKSAHIKLKEFFNKEPNEQERIINSNIQAHKDIEQEKKEKEQEKNKNRNRGFSR